MLALQLCLKDEFRTQKNSKRESISTTSCMTRNWRHDSPENCYSIWKNTLTESRESSSPGKHIQFSHGEKLDFSFPCLEFCHCVKVFLIFNMHCSRVVPKAVSDIPKYNLLRFFPGLSDYIEKNRAPVWVTEDPEARYSMPVKLQHLQLHSKKVWLEKFPPPPPSVWHLCDLWDKYLLSWPAVCSGGTWHDSGARAEKGKDMEQGRGSSLSIFSESSITRGCCLWDPRQLQIFMCSISSPPGDREVLNKLMGISHLHLSLVLWLVFLIY